MKSTSTSKKAVREGASLSSSSPKVIAAIDIGATSVRMEIAETSGYGNRRVLDRLVHPIALGADTFRFGAVRSETIRSLCQVLQNFQHAMGEYEVSHYRAVGTSALREATNVEVIVDRIRHETSLDVQSLDPVEEGRLTYLLLKPHFEMLPRVRPVGKPFLTVFDIGGGSTEIMVLKGRNLILTGSSRLGTSRLTYQLMTEAISATQQHMDSMVTNFVGAMDELLHDYPAGECLIINTLLVNPKLWDGVSPNELGSLRVNRADIAALGVQARRMAPDAIAERFDMPIVDAELLAPTITSLEHIAAYVDTPEVQLVSLDFPSGLMLEMETEMQGSTLTDLFYQQTLSSVSGIMEKYRVETAHAEHVRRMSMRLFDLFSELLDLTTEDRLFLEVASMLHDIGRFICDRDHHKHSAYIIRWLEVAGLSEEALDLVALVARYHRKARPRSTHADLGRLSSQNRMRVIKLASLLRIADALDRTHKQMVSDVRIEIHDDSVELLAVTAGDIDIIVAVLKQKGAVFEEVTGLKLLLRKVAP